MKKRKRARRQAPKKTRRPARRRRNPVPPPGAYILAVPRQGRVQVYPFANETAILRAAGALRGFDLAAQSYRGRRYGSALQAALAALTDKHESAYAVLKPADVGALKAHIHRRRPRAWGELIGHLQRIERAHHGSG